MRRVQGSIAALFLLVLAGCAEEETYAWQPAVAPVAAAAPVAPPPKVSASRVNAVLAYAAAQVGRPYCWGGVGPRCFDCSGLAMMAWRQAGVRIPRTADDVAKQLPPVAMNELRPGDILWWPGHVGIYAGDGWSIEALDSRSGVVRRRPLGARRAFRPVVF
jgi:cell wall-associated NlpC family hydrolase